MALHVKKGDNVVVIAGKDKGKNGRVLSAIPADNAVVVSGVNIVAKHQKAKSAQDKSAIVKRENKIDASNVLVVCPVCNKATRVSYAVEGDKKHRQCKKCGASLDKAFAKKEVKKEAKKEVKTTKKAEAKVAEKKAPAKSVAKKETVKKTETKKATTKKTQSKGQ